MIDAAIVGLGWWGKVHVEAIQAKSKRIRYVIGVTKEPDEIGDFATTHGLRISTAFDDVLADDSIEAVVLATPHSLHTGQILAAAASGKHVFCEKPLTLTKADAQRSVVACREAGVVLGVGQNRRLWPAIAEIKRLIDDGALGTILHVEGNYSHDWLADSTSGGWRNAPEETPAGGMTGMGIHLVDNYIHLIGDIDWVHAQCVDRILNRASGDTVSALLRFAGGATGYLGTTLVTPYIWRLQVFGSESWVESRGETDLTICRRGGTPERIDLEEVDTVRLQIEAFADAIEGKKPFPISPDHMVHTAAAMEAIFRSVELGAPVDVA